MKDNGTAVVGGGDRYRFTANFLRKEDNNNFWEKEAREDDGFWEKGISFLLFLAMSMGKA